MREKERAMSASFCASDLWDLQLTWNTTNPDFTPCFHQSVLTYIPTAVLILALPFQVDIRDMRNERERAQLSTNLNPSSKLPN